MRFLDIVVAALIGLSSVTAIYVWSPEGSDLASYRAGKQALLRDQLTKILVAGGLVWLQRSTPSDICSRFGSLSNSSVTFAASVDSIPCTKGPPRGAVGANLTVLVNAKEVILEAWSNAPG